MNAIRKLWPSQQSADIGFNVRGMTEDRRNRRQKESYQLIEVDRKRLRDKALTDAEIQRKYFSPEADQHFKDKYPPGCWERE